MFKERITVVISNIVIMEILIMEIIVMVICQGLQLYYYYSHIFPDFRAQHCNYAALLAGNNKRYSIIFPMCPSLYSMLVFLVRVTGLLRRR